MLSKALLGRRIILTRTHAENLSFAGTLSDLGADVHSVPMIELQPLPADQAIVLRSAIDGLEQYGWVVFTSSNGVRAVVEHLGSRPWPADVHVAAIGPATVAAAEEHGMPVKFVPSRATAEDLVNEFPAQISPEPPRVLAALAELALPTVTVGLIEKGYEVDHVVAYRTGAPKIDPVTEPAVRAQVMNADVVVFASPSAAARFVDRFGTSRTAAVVCIGPTTAKRATSLGLSVTSIAQSHSEQGLFAAVQAVLVDDIC